MTHTYDIKGMTCNNCVAKVKNALLHVDGILNADVQLNSQSTIEMQQHLTDEKLQRALSNIGKYTIHSSGNHKMKMNDERIVEDATETKTWLQIYKPLLLVFAFITGVSFLSAYQHNFFDAKEWMRFFMAGFFLTFSFFKMLDITAFGDSYCSYDMLAKNWRGYGFIYPFIELILGIFYLTNFQPFYTNLATILVMSFSSIGVILAVVNKQKIQCACLGAVFNLPMSTVTIVEDLLMIVMAAVFIFS